MKQEVCGEKYNPFPMFVRKKVVSRMLNEDIERQDGWRMVRQVQREQQTFHKKEHEEQER